MYTSPQTIGLHVCDHRTMILIPPLSIFTLCLIRSVDIPSDIQGSAHGAWRIFDAKTAHHRPISGQDAEYHTSFRTDSPHSLLFSTCTGDSTKNRSKSYNTKTANTIWLVWSIFIISQSDTTYIFVNICINSYYRVFLHIKSPAQSISHVSC